MKHLEHEECLSLFVVAKRIKATGPSAVLIPRPARMVVSCSISGVRGKAKAISRRPCPRVVHFFWFSIPATGLAQLGRPSSMSCWSYQASQTCIVNVVLTVFNPWRRRCHGYVTCLASRERESAEATLLTMASSTDGSMTCHPRAANQTVGSNGPTRCAPKDKPQQTHQPKCHHPRNRPT